MKNIITIILSSVLGGVISLVLYFSFANSSTDILSVLEGNDNQTPIINTNHSTYNTTYADFSTASKKSINAVVHVKNVSVSTPNANSFWDHLLGEHSTPKVRMGSGSGVIISPDGYIVTNNHVIKGANQLSVTLNNNKTYEAKIIGNDASTDIALLKIDTDEKLPTLSFGNSDDTKIGEWVLAVGNPFNLTSTVTAGIISAKSRDLNLKDNKNQSFIQTDAVINSGNSGGALVNINGDLIGINTAITSYTGVYMGYSFAVPSNIVKKVVEDILEFGSVQKVILGVSGNDLNSIEAKRLNIEDTEGFFVKDVEESSGAAMAGIKTNDIIKKIDNITINKYADLTGYLSTKRPKEKVRVTIKRNGKERELFVRLSKNNIVFIRELGIKARDISNQEKRIFKTNSGIKIIQSFRRYNNDILKDKVITNINGIAIKDINDVQKALENINQHYNITLTLINKKGQVERLIFKM